MPPEPPPPPLAEQPTEHDDVRACQQALARGSHSFALAGRLLPRALLADAAGLYAFCREADDAIDDAPSLVAARARHAELSSRLAQLACARSAGPLPGAADRTLWRAVARHRLPLTPLHRLLEGMLWDAEGRRYEHLADTLRYAARVAGSVGVLLAHLCGVRERHVLARAADMGTAMQLTNIARDVGEDAARGRLYLPRAWLRAAGLSPEAWLAAPASHPGVAAATERLLAWADRLYARARLGLHALPPAARISLATAGRIYQRIGTDLRRHAHDNLSRRAHVPLRGKLWAMGEALVLDGWRPRRAASRRALGRPCLSANAVLFDEAKA